MSPADPQRTAEPLVSFVVPAWNEERELPATLAAIREAAAGLEHEVVVADDASTDRTAEIAREQGARVVECDHRRISATRNSGARVARGRYLVFVDADTRVSRDAVRAAVEALERGATYGSGDFEFDTPLPLLWRLPARLMVLGCRLGKLGFGAFLFCTREAFEEVGGFDDTLNAAEELWICRALRRTGRHAWVRHPVTTSARKLRTHSARELFTSLALILMGRWLLRRRKDDLWYGERRPDPAVDGEERAR